MDDIASHRERKKARTRDAMAEQAMELFLARGFGAATVDEIAAGGGVCGRTFFRYFPVKEAVVFARNDERLRLFRELLHERQAGDRPLDVVRRALRRLSRELTADRRTYLRQQRLVETTPQLLAYERELDRQWEATLGEALVAGDSQSPRTARILAGAVMGAVRATLTLWCQGGCRGDLMEMGEETLDLLARGVEGGAGPERERLAAPAFPKKSKVTRRNEK